jgi:hypothetical protein
MLLLFYVLFQLYVTSITTSGRRDIRSLAATLVLVVHWEDTTDSHSENAMLHLEKVLLHKERDEFWLMGYRVWHQIYPAHRTQLSFNIKGMHAAWKCLLLTYNEATFQTNVGDVFFRSEYWCWYSLNAARGFPPQELYTKCISTHFALVNPGLLVVDIVLVTDTTVRVWQLFFTYVLTWSLSPEPLPNDHNNTKRHHRKHVVTPKRKTIYKKSIYIFSSN